MTRFLHRQITNESLLESNRRYEGTILAVEADTVVNRWRYTTTAEGKVVPKTELVPRIKFADGFEWIPNNRARRTLTEAWGPDTDQWIGLRLAIYLVLVSRGEEEKPEKRCEPLSYPESAA